MNAQLNQIHLRPSNGPNRLLSRDKDKQCGTVNLTASKQQYKTGTKQWYDRLKRVINPNNLPMILIKLAKANIMI
jgi:hypothetical protein